MHEFRELNLEDFVEAILSVSHNKASLALLVQSVIYSYGEEQVIAGLTEALYRQHEGGTS